MSPRPMHSATHYSNEAASVHGIAQWFFVDFVDSVYPVTNY